MPALADPRREQFAQEYARTRNGPLAALNAGYSAGTRHHQISSAKDIAGRIQELWEVEFADANITPERVMRELERIAFQDIRPIFDADGQLLPMHMLDDDVAATIASVDVETRWEGKGDAATPVYTKKVRRVDKMAALSILARHFKIVGDDNDGVSALANALADRLKSARQRAFNGQPFEEAVIVEPATPAATPALPEPQTPVPTLQVQPPAREPTPARPAPEAIITEPKPPKRVVKPPKLRLQNPQPTAEVDDEQLW